MDELRQIFIDECLDLLEQLSDGLGQIEDGHADGETINMVFRAVHSIKGSAGAFGIDDLVTFAHRTENVLDALRSEKLSVHPGLMATLYRASDQIAKFVEAFRDNCDPLTDDMDEILRDLDAHLAQNVDGGDGADIFAPLALDLGDLGVPVLDQVEPQTYAITFRPDAAFFRFGHDPAALFSELSALGQLEVMACTDALPEFATLTADDCYLYWELRLTTASDEEEIVAVFEFVRDHAEIEIAPNATISTDPHPVIAIPIEIGKDEPTTIVKVQDQTFKPSLRVSLDKVDRLVNTIGELIINQSMLSQFVEEKQISSRPLRDQLESYRLLARDLQEEAMSIRAQPVKPLFQRMARVVREAAASVDKSVILVTEGVETEIDKTLIERLAEPLTHMVRNAVDHGLEPTEERLRLGKPETGEIVLAAAHRSGSVIIEVRDDGAGVNRERVLAKALEKGLVPHDAELSDTEIDNLLFAPGFSTAGEVSNLSGRGVGMDVVKTAVVEMGGRVAVSSTPGKGAVFSIIVPLTLAVMDGMVISIAGQLMVVPIAAISEAVFARQSDLITLGTGEACVSIRGTLLPIVQVSKCLGLAPKGGDDPMSGIFLIAETQFGKRCAFAINEIVDQRQVVIKNLDGMTAKTPGISAATILGNGEIAMILDPDGLVLLAQDDGKRHTRERAFADDSASIQ